MSPQDPVARPLEGVPSAAPSLIPDPQAIVLKSSDLFAGKRQIWIEHAGSYYRLSITSRGKLILQK